MVPCVLVKGEPGNDGKPGRQGIPGNPGEKVGEEAPLCEHPLALCEMTPATAWAL